MVREVQMSWDSQTPIPYELLRTDWDLEDPAELTMPQPVPRTNQRSSSANPNVSRSPKNTPPPQDDRCQS